MTITPHKAAPGRVPQMDLADRLSRTLRETGIGVSEMAGYLGVTRETIGRWINGRNVPKRAGLMAWASITGVDLEWLETGHASAEVVTPDEWRARRDSNPQPSGLESDGARLRVIQGGRNAVRVPLTAESRVTAVRTRHLRAVS